MYKVLIFLDELIRGEICLSKDIPSQSCHEVFQAPSKMPAKIFLNIENSGTMHGNNL